MLTKRYPIIIIKRLKHWQQCRSGGDIFLELHNAHTSTMHVAHDTRVVFDVK